MVLEMGVDAVAQADGDQPIRLVVLTRGPWHASCPVAPLRWPAYIPALVLACENHAWTKPLRGSYFLRLLIMGADLSWVSAR